MRTPDPRRSLLLALVLPLIAGTPHTAIAASLVPLQVAAAGSMGSLLDGGIKPAVAEALHADLRVRAQGAAGLANLIVAGSIRPDVFISVTAGPMRSVLKAGKANVAIPVARTEMVIAYSRKSRFAAALEKAGEPGAEQWWRILETPGLRFGRTDPETDPQGLNIIFTMQLAAKYYNQPGLVDKIIGPLINPRQIFQEAQMMARLQGGQLDASSAYKTQPAAFGVPFVSLPGEINLADPAMTQRYAAASIKLHGRVYRPTPLVFYAGVLTDAPHPALATKFLTWLKSDGARRIFRRYYYDAPGSARPLTR